MSQSSSFALVVALCLAAFAAAGTAEAKPSGGSKGSVTSSKSVSLSKVVASKPVVHDKHRFRYYAYATPVVYAAYSSCGWLRAKALATDSRYWWARYEACRDES